MIKSKRRSTRMAVISIATAALTAALFMTAGVAMAESPPAFMLNLFSPELVIQNQRAISLRDDQRKKITQAIKKTQAETLELQWSLQTAASTLEGEILQDQIDEKKALETAAEMMEIEGQVKRAHLGLLIQIRNQLDPDQRTQLKRLRKNRD